jgi:copper transport protein
MHRTTRAPGRRTLWARGLVTAGCALAILVVAASPASAHAALIGADPAPGTSLPQAPGAVVLHFSEAVDHVRSSITVTGPGGRDATSGPAEAVPNDGRALRRPLGLERPGRYDVTWTSVSVDDGHVESGRYSFGIGTPAPASRGSRGGAASSEGLLGLFSELVLVVGLTLWAGALFLGHAATRAGVVPERLAAARKLSPALALSAVVVRAAAAGAKAPALGRVVPTIVAGRSGELGTVLVAVAATVGLLARRRAWVSLSAALVALTAQAASAHAGAARVPVVAIAVLVVHLVGAGVWLAAIMAALFARRLRRALAVLSPYAMASAVVVVSTGVAGAALERVGPGQLLTTGYGRVLVVKASVFVAVAGLGGWQVYRRHRRPSARKLQTPVRLEAAAAGVALIVATVLAASPPPTRFQPLLADSSAGSVLGPLDGRQALSIADVTGRDVVGLTISPAHAGPVNTRVEILSTIPSDVFSDVSIHATGPESSSDILALRPVSAGVFAGVGRIQRNGDWSFSVSFHARGGSSQVTLAATLPAPDGSGVLAEAFAAEERLTSARLHETLRSEVGSAPITADYQFRAPDSFTFAVNGTSEVDIGALAYNQDQRSGPWSVHNTGFAFGWPSPYFREVWADATAARVVGADVIDGVASHIVAFVRPDLPAWFELWIGDSDGLVRREEMRAEGHLMEHDYSGFNTPTQIAAPRTTQPTPS